jgi:hypothetical protein
VALPLQTKPSLPLLLSLLFMSQSPLENWLAIRLLCQYPLGDRTGILIGEAEIRPNDHDPQTHPRHIVCFLLEIAPPAWPEAARQNSPVSFEQKTG